MELQMERNTLKSKIHGEVLGEIRASFTSSELETERENVEFNWLPHTLLHDSTNLNLINSSLDE
jgi:hypothetical protein